MTRSTTRPPPLISESAFLTNVLSLAKLLGWRCYHARPGRTLHSWRTPVSADGVGWPDLFMVRGHRAIAAELKSGRGHLSDEQRFWLIALQATGVETFTWYPEHIQYIEEILR